MTSSRRPDSWIVPGGGVEPEEEPAATALREVREEAGVVGSLGRCLGVFEVCFAQILLISVFFNIVLSSCCRFFKNLFSLIFQNVEHKHRTQVWVMRVTEEMPEWEDSRAIGRKRKWFSIAEALIQLAQHKPVQRSYLHSLRNTNPRCNSPNSPTSLHSPHGSPAPIQVMNNSGSNPHPNKNS